MVSEDDIKKRLSRRFPRKKHGRQVTLEIPERLKLGDDADDDITAAPQGSNALMNQSVFGMIAAAGSQVDFNARFDGQSSDDEDHDEHDVPPTEASAASPTTATSQELPQPLRKSPSDTSDKSSKHRRKFSENKLMRSLPRLNVKNLKPKHMAQSMILPRDRQTTTPPDISSPPNEATHSRDAPVMSRMLEAQAELALRPSFDIPDRSRVKVEQPDSEDLPASNLALRLMEIFEFEAPEAVIEEYPCWLLKSVLLQGYMYITSKHICFYAYLPKKANVVVKTGYLGKRGLKNPKYNRYWFRLKGDVLSYYTDPSDLYFPSGNIDLRYGISANILDKEKGKDATHFSVVTHQRTYSFKADSAQSAKEWVKALQKIIFRSHNDGDSVKISLPIENVIDIEDSQIVEFADTCKIRVIDNDETYAIDEYFFSFFSFGKEALRVLRLLVEDTAAQHLPEDLLQPGVPDGSSSPGYSASNSAADVLDRHKVLSPKLEDTVKATLSPMLSPTLPQSARTSTDFSRQSRDGRRSMDLSKLGRRSVDLSRFSTDTPARRSFSASRRSMSANRLGETKMQMHQSSSDSYVHSMDDPTSAAVASMSEDTQASASQILRGSDVFRSPTIQRSASAAQKRDSVRKGDDLASDPHKMGPPHHAYSTGQIGNPPSLNADASVSAPSLQSVIKAGAYPLQRAAAFTGYLNRHTQRMSTLIASDAMGYVEKVSGMWKGGRKHYDEPDGLGLHGDDEDLDDEQILNSRMRFREHFALPESEKLQAAYFGYLHRVLPLYGKIYISERSFCFRSLLPGTRTKLILPLKDIENVDKERGFRFGYSGLVIVVKGHEEIFFEFGNVDTRDDLAVTLLQNLETLRYLEESGILSQEQKEDAETAVAEHRALQEARHDGSYEHDLKLPRDLGDVKADAPPILFDDPRASILNFKPAESLRITCLTIGSRGDVQPYIALCRGLLAEGHKPRIATHHEFKGWVESHGIEFAPVEGDPAELMRICVENGMFTYSFLKEASSKFRGWLDELCSSAWKACQGSDILIESPSAMAGIHIAEALAIPYFRAFTMPWTRTRAYPHAFIVPEHKMGGAYNYITYVMFDNVFWKAIASQINRWRKNELGLPRTNLELLQPNKVPFLYNFSPSVVVPPLDYSDWIRVTGYWFLDEGQDWTPPKEITDFIAKARADNKKIVYIGFGSIVVADSAALTRTVVASVKKADVRCILSKGWSDRLDKKVASDAEVQLPPEILQIKSAPHDWLFRQIDAAAHHGGSGTTGASLRAGIPTIIKPFFGDQFFFGSRVEDLGVGIYLKKLNVSLFSRALWEASHSERMVLKAKILGEQIRKENGVETAIQAIYRDLDYAKSLIKKKDKTADPMEEFEESWTFVGDESEPEMARRSETPVLDRGSFAKSDSTGRATARHVSPGSNNLGTRALGASVGKA